ncbi:MAG: nuclear transport factor 2 family protein [Caulobacteraceae bacterium]
MDPEVKSLLDKAAIAELVQTERAARDQGQWDRMAACYWPKSVVSISWINTSGPEFVEASKKAFAEGVRHIHHMAPTLVTLKGDRALAETGCEILLGGKIGGVAVSVTSQARLHCRVERRNGAWKLISLTAAYFGDAMAAKNPREIPPLDSAQLASYRETYRFLAYLLAQSGKAARPDLAGIDRPDLMKRLHDAEAAWLAG